MNHKLCVCLCAHVYIQTNALNLTCHILQDASIMSCEQLKLQLFEHLVSFTSLPIKCTCLMVSKSLNSQSLRILE